MRTRKLSDVIWLLSAVVLAAGCSSPSASFAPAPSTRPSPLGISTPTVGPTQSPAAIATDQAATSRMPSAELVGKTVMTAIDGVRVRSKPGIGDDSLKMRPLLPLGTKLFVVAGPVSASGYDWFDVAPLATRALPSGWVARAARDSEPWIEPAAFDCPPVPTDIRTLAALPHGVGVACFPRVPITVRARLLGCNCDMDGSWFTPSWFFLGSGGPDLLIDPDTTVRSIPANPDDWFVLDLDPNSQHPDVLPVGEVVDVTGIFDHPAAATCTRTDMDGAPAPSGGCRLEFAVTKLVSRP